MTAPYNTSLPTNLAEYTEPELYDLEKQEFTPDGPFFLALAQRIGGPVLDLGCGTGRITIPLAHHGLACTGLDAVPKMLDRARQKAGNLMIRWVEGDARSFQLNQQFGLILDTGPVIQHVFERADQEAILARVRDHLAPDGRYVTSTLFPRAGLMTDLDDHEWFSYQDHHGRTVRVSGPVYYDKLRQLYHEDATRRWHDAAGQEIVHLAPFALRIFFPQELEALLHYNGLAVCERYGDWNQSPLAEDSPMMILVCKRRDSHGTS